MITAATIKTRSHLSPATSQPETVHISQLCRDEVRFQLQQRYGATSLFVYSGVTLFPGCGGKLGGAKEEKLILDPTIQINYDVKLNKKGKKKIVSL